MSINRQDSRLHHLVPIPTYEEAISRPSSSQRTRGPAEISDDAERQAFLQGRGGRHGGYQQPAVGSDRNSMDSSLSVPDMVDDEHEARRQVEELDYMESDDTGRNTRTSLFHRARLRKISNRLNGLSATLSAIRLPSLRRRYTPVADGPGGHEPSQESATSGSARWVPGWRIPDNYRMSVPVFARLFALFIIASFVYTLFAMDLFPGALRRHGIAATMFNPESVREYIESQINLDDLEHYVEHLSSFAHEAGSEGNFFLAKWMEEKWSEVCDLDSLDLSAHRITATYPVEGERWVRIIDPASEMASPMWEEEIDHERPDRELTLVWHGYSKSGVVQGPLIHAGRGTLQDFQKLQSVNISGSIAIVEGYGGDSDLSTALQIHAAEEAGCIGVLLANLDSNRSASSQTTQLFEDSVHRANVVLSNWVLGDPMKMDIDQPGIPRIPSFPISQQNAELLHGVLRGKTSQTSSLEREADDRRQTHGVVVELGNQNDEVQQQKIWNLHGTIKGAEYPNQKIILAAPRDSWCYGATDSASASALLTAVIAVFGELARQTNWKPLRTIEFISWDARTMNSAGSTEYVVQQLEALHDGAVAYVNVESAFGDIFYAQGSPVLQRVLEHAMERVVAPGENETIKTMFDTPDLDDGTYQGITPLRLPGSEGDFAPFAHIAGVPVLDFGFGGDIRDIVKGSCHDTMSWLNKFEDKRATVQKALVQIMALVVLNLVAAPLLPLDTTVVAERFAADLGDFTGYVHQHLFDNGLGDKVTVADFDPLLSAAEDLKASARNFHGFETEWTATVMGGGGLENLYWNGRRVDYNEHIAAFEKFFVGKPGSDEARSRLKDRPQFRHVLYAPKKWSTGVQILPTIWEIIEDRRWTDLKPEVERVAGMIRQASSILVVDS